MRRVAWNHPDSDDPEIARDMRVLRLLFVFLLAFGLAGYGLAVWLLARLTG